MANSRKQLQVCECGCLQCRLVALETAMSMSNAEAATSANPSFIWSTQWDGVEVSGAGLAAGRQGGC